MQIAPDQGTFLRLLVAATGARRAVEVGTFTGMSAICIARGLGPEGRLLCCDVSEEWTAIARRYWAQAGVADRIELRLGPAAETLRSFPRSPPSTSPSSTRTRRAIAVYYEEILKRLRPGGLVAVDNVLWSGDVVRPEKQDDDARGHPPLQRPRGRGLPGRIRDPPLADGLTLARKR